MNQSERNNIHIIGVPEEEEREKGIESVFKEIIAENFPKLEEEVPRTPNRRDPRRTTPTHIIIKMEKMEDKDQRLDEVQGAVNGIEIREQEHREAEAERDERISRNETILREL